jgi:hypothetical protein
VWHYFHVIPGLAKREPGIHTHSGGYGFRARRYAAPRNDGGASGPETGRSERCGRYNENPPPPSPLLRDYETKDTADIWNIPISDQVTSPTMRRVKLKGHGVI